MFFNKDVCYKGDKKHNFYPRYSTTSEPVRNEVFTEATYLAQNR